MAAAATARRLIGCAEDENALEERAAANAAEAAERVKRLNMMGNHVATYYCVQTKLQKSL